jgi:hypothetical protein
MAWRDVVFLPRETLHFTASEKSNDFIDDPCSSQGGKK